jgi:hypothetical protein
MSMLHDPFPPSELDERLPTRKGSRWARGIACAVLLVVAAAVGIHIFGSPSTEDHPSLIEHAIFVLATLGGMVLVIALVVDAITDPFRGL